MRFRRSSVLLLLCCLLAALASAGPASANPGDLDTSFGQGGLATQVVDGHDTSARSIAQAPDGKIVVGGTSVTSPQELFVMRYNQDGSLDTTFSGDGVAIITNEGNYINGGKVAVQPDGKIVVAGVGTFSGQQQFVVTRLNTDGSPDPTFAGGGLAHFSVSSNNYLYAVALQPDGKVLLAGSTTPSANEEIAVVRVDPDGLLDSSFDGGAGASVIGVTGVSLRPYAIAVGPGGSISLVGHASVSPYDEFVAARLTSTGLLDTSFGGTGHVLNDVHAGDDGLRAMAVQPDGKIVASGAINGSSGGDVGAIARYNNDGSLDQSFGSGGIVRDSVSAAGESFCFGLTLDSAGRITVACGADSSASSNSHLVLVRYLPNGSRDVTFGVGGATPPLAQSVVYPEAAALQSDGKILAAGDIETVSPTPLIVARYLGGSLAPTPPSVPTDKISSPSKSKLKASKLKKFAGTAGPAGLVSKVQIGLRRFDAKTLKQKQCLWLSSSKAKFKKVKDKKKKCASPRWLTAKGTTAWSYKLKKSLPKGKYRLYVRVALSDGITNSAFTPATGTLKSFTLK